MYQLGKIPYILMEPRGPSAWSQEPAFGPYTELHEYATPSPAPFKVNFNLHSYLPLVLPHGIRIYFFFWYA
jgi:hypothetical protein